MAHAITVAVVAREMLQSLRVVALADQVTQGSSPAKREMEAGQEEAVHSKNVAHPVTPSPGTAKSGGKAGSCRAMVRSHVHLQSGCGSATHLAGLVFGDPLFL